jgi:hypothetical protein
MSRSLGRQPAARVLLERRYRMLLAWYPGAYRAANEDEMLGVALAGAAPDQRRPGLGEAASLITSGIRTRFGLLLPGLRDSAWRDAAATFAILGPILLAAIHAESLVGQLAAGPFEEAGQLSTASIVLAGGWSLVAGAAIWRWRRIAAVGASLAAASEAAHVATRYASAPSFLVVSWWQLMLAVTTALAAVTLLAGPPGGNRPLSRRVIAAVTALAAVLVAAPAIESALTTFTSYDDGAVVAASNPMFGAEGLLREGLLAGLALMLLVAVARLSAAARRRVLVLSVPVAAVAVLTAWGFRGFLASSPQFPHPVLLSAPQWAALAAVPVLGFAAGMMLISRHERMIAQ